MKRQITIYESAKNGKITVLEDVECSTLGELKRILDTKGIEYSGKEFIEGVTNTKLLGDDSRLPENIPFKNKTTSNLFINILNANNKIKSGADLSKMSRAELLRAAKPYASDIEKKFGANYTRVKSADIVAFLSNKKSSPAKSEEVAEQPEKTNEYSLPTIQALTEAVLAIAEELDMENSIEKILYPCGKTKTEEKKKKEPESFFSQEDIAKFIKKK